MCGFCKVWVCVCADIVMCVCLGNICTCIYCVLYCLYCVFVLSRLCILFVLSVLVQGLLLPSENSISVSNNNNNNNGKQFIDQRSLKVHLLPSS